MFWRATGICAPSSQAASSRRERSDSHDRRRDPPRPLRDPLAARRGGDGRGLAGARLAARPRRRDQGAARVLLGGRGPAAAVRAGGAGRPAS